MANLELPDASNSGGDDNVNGDSNMFCSIPEPYEVFYSEVNLFMQNCDRPS
jgi:hypothetical protein